MMKKILPLLILFIACLFISCVDGFPEVAVCEFSEYDILEINKENWKEPDSYSFTYDLRYGDSFVTNPVKVTIKNSNATFEFDGEDEILNDETMPFGGLRIYSITDLYERIEVHWKETEKRFDKNGDISYVFNTEFKTLAGYGMYPALFDEDQFRINVKEDYDGYGGLYIKVLDITVDCP